MPCPSGERQTKDKRKITAAKKANKDIPCVKKREAPAAFSEYRAMMAASACPPGTRRSKDVRKREAAKKAKLPVPCVKKRPGNANPGFVAWNLALKEVRGAHPGQFLAAPKKGTPEYFAVKAVQKRLLAGAVPARLTKTKKRPRSSAEPAPSGRLTRAKLDLNAYRTSALGLQQDVDGMPSSRGLSCNSGDHVA